MTVKERLHQLVEALPESELPVAERFLQYLRDLGADPLLRALALAEDDDEPTSADEDAAVAQAWAEYQRGEARPWEAVRDELAGD